MEGGDAFALATLEHLLAAAAILVAANASPNHASTIADMAIVAAADRLRR